MSDTRPPADDHGATDDHPGIVAPPPLIFLVPLLLGLALRWGAPLPPLSLEPWVRVALGPPLVALGGALGAWGFVTMRRARTPVDPWKTPRALVTAGPFARSRNPLYVALTLVYAGLALSCDALHALALLAPALVVLRQGVVLREERYLQRKFGDEYRAYAARVRRWL